MDRFIAFVILFCFNITSPLPLLSAHRNRVLKKPAYQAAADCATRDVATVARTADAAWRQHRARNLSIVVELLQGQLQSTLQCPGCQKLSVTFDPFMYLSVPVPDRAAAEAAERAERRFEVTVVRADGSAPPTLYAIEVPAAGTIAHARAALTRAIAASSSSGSSRNLALAPSSLGPLVFADVYKSRVYKVLADSTPLVAIRDSDTTFAFEQDMPSASSMSPSCMYVQVVSEVRNAAIAGSVAQVFGTPLVVELPVAPSGHLVWKAVARRVRMWLPSPFNGSGNGSDSGSAMGRSLDALFAASKSKLPFRLRIKDRALAKCGLCSGGGARGGGCGGVGCEIRRDLDDDSACGLTDAHSIVVDWTPAVVIAQADAFDLVERRDMSGSSGSGSGMRIGNAQQSEVVTLRDCVRAFVAQEQLGKSNAWYCSACKAHVLASKKLDLWRCPEVLIVHLKRFSGNRQKIGRLVDFPLQGLDLTEFVRCSTQDDDAAPIYDLYAVSNHMGGLHGGHYTAFARHLENERWYLLDDSRAEPVAEHAVKTSAAYVLFYRRRH